jgi:exosortase
LALPLVALAWAYWTTFVDLAATWNTNPQYSHGFLVPLFGAYLLYHRRDQLKRDALKPSIIGLFLIVFALAIKLVGTYGHFVSLDPISLIPCVAGLVFLYGGWAAWKWAWPAVLFLAFMIPLPYFAAVAMSGQLQTLATITSTFVMQTLGLPALAEGNVILLNDEKIGIVEACSGLRMLVVFFALSTAMVLVVNRHWTDRVIILLSAIPIALISNILRIIATGLMYNAGQSEMANHFFHDIAGWLMMPLGLGLLWVELWVLSALIVTVPRATIPPRPAGTRRAVPRPAAARTRQKATGLVRQDAKQPVEQR